ncbi:MAG: cbb3-type cytochrome c oxidase subunit 3 [Thermodesulfovibrionales bacterium]
MLWSGWIFFGFTIALFIAFVVVVIHYYNPKRKEKIEKPKYRLFDDDDERNDIS